MNERQASFPVRHAVKPKTTKRYTIITTGFIAAGGEFDEECLQVK